ERYNRRLSGLSPAALRLLMNFDWPGNVRQLRSFIERAVVLAAGDTLSEAELKQMMGIPDREKGILPLKEARERFEREYIAQILQAHEWKMDASAAVLGIDRTNLYKKIQKLGVRRR
ncbi:MAG TPA: helix-turn-helix domain-containing protein, partial [bacterium]|nr:helix-turn-helix domain-containing protein [bacterium]